MLAWVDLVDDVLPTKFVIAGKPAILSSTPFYDVEASRARS